MCDHCGCHDFPSIGELSAEHDTILTLAWQVAQAVHDERPVDEGVRASLRALLVSHAAKEETGLYPQLRLRGDLSPHVSARLEDEHRDVLLNLVGTRFDRRAYYELAAHIEEEEMELFPAAMFAFEDDDWDRMDRAHVAAAG